MKCHARELRFSRSPVKTTSRAMLISIPAWTLRIRYDLRLSGAGMKNILVAANQRRVLYFHFHCFYSPPHSPAASNRACVRQNSEYPPRSPRNSKPWRPADHLVPCCAWPSFMATTSKGLLKSL